MTDRSHRVSGAGQRHRECAAAFAGRARNCRGRAGVPAIDAARATPSVAIRSQGSRLSRSGVATWILLQPIRLVQEQRPHEQEQGHESRNHGATRDRVSRFLDSAESFSP
jgi:hypothetical protein